MLNLERESEFNASLVQFSKECRRTTFLFAAFQAHATGFEFEGKNWVAEAEARNLS